MCSLDRKNTSLHKKVCKKEMAEHANSTKEPRKGMKRSDCEREEMAVGNVPLPFVPVDSLLLHAEVIKFKLKDTPGKRPRCLVTQASLGCFSFVLDLLNSTWTELFLDDSGTMQNFVDQQFCLILNVAVEKWAELNRSRTNEKYPKDAYVARYLGFCRTKLVF